MKKRHPYMKKRTPKLKPKTPYEKALHKFLNTPPIRFFDRSHDMDKQ